jgi:invasion protein IalB
MRLLGMTKVIALCVSVAMLMGSAAMPASAQDGAAAPKPAEGVPVPRPAPRAAAPAAATPTAELPDGPPVSPDAWLKMCEATGKGACRTGFDIFSETSQLLASMVLTVSGDGKQREVVFTVPSSVKLANGLKLKIGDTEDLANYVICYPNQCLAARSVDTAFIDRLRKAPSVTATAIRETDDEITFTFPMDTFSAAFDGKPVTDEDMAKRNRMIQERAVSKRKSLQEQLLEAQRKAMEQQ